MWPVMGFPCGKGTKKNLQIHDLQVFYHCREEC